MDDDWAQGERAEQGGIGPLLRDDRVAQGLTIEQVAAETRIPQRHLHAIEAGDFDALPARTYAIGFARTYAKVLGLDPEAVVFEVRREIGAQPQPRDDRNRFEPGDPARVPSAGLSWLAVAAVVLLVVGGFFFMRTLFAPAAELPSLIAQQEQEEQEAAAVRIATQRQAATASDPDAAQPSDPVVFTAQGTAWVRFTDAQGRRLMEGEMEEGESYTVPADAEGPLLLTGRPDLLSITIGGEPVPPISRELETVTDVPVTAEALLARAGPPPASSPTN